MAYNRRERYLNSKGGRVGIGCFANDSDATKTVEYRGFQLVCRAHCRCKATLNSCEAFDDDIAFDGDLLLEFDGCRARECGFDVAVDFEVALREMRFDAVEEYVASTFGYVEKSDGQSIE